MNPLDAFINDSILMKQTFAEPEWLIPGIIPQGLTILAGKPKIGKSWWSLQIASDLSEAGTDVLYMGLEDPFRRLQERLELVRGHAQGNGHLTLCGQGIFPRLDAEGLQYLREWLIRCPSCKLIIIDTLAMIKPRARANSNAYEDDTQVMRSIKAIADEFKIGIIVVLHLRKFEDPDDPFANISGTNALGGCADTILVLSRSRQSNDATLFITGREVEIPETPMTWVPDTCRWTLERQAQQEKSEVGQAIIKVLQDSNRSLTMKEITSFPSIGYKENTIKGRLTRMVRNGTLLHVENLYCLPSGFTSVSANPSLTETCKT
jgi:hypothetical protein